MLLVSAWVPCLYASSFTDQDVINLEFQSTEAISGAVTYALASALSDTVSAEIDLGAATGIAIGVTSTNAALLDVEWSNITGTEFKKAYSLYAGDNYMLGKRGRFVRFRSTTTNSPTGTLTVYYNTLSAPAIGSVTLAANDGVDIGDTTNNNAAGASAVNIQDGGNSITIDQTFPTGASAQEVQGTAAHSASSDKPVVIAGVDHLGNVQEIKVVNGAQAVSQLTVGSDGQSNGAMTILQAYMGSSTTSAPLSIFGHVFNDTDWDRMRGDTEGLWTKIYAETGIPEKITITGGGPTLPLAVDQIPELFIPTDTPGSNLFGVAYIGNVGVTNTVGALEAGGNLATVAGAVAGTEMQVDLVTGPTGASALEIQGVETTGMAVVGKGVLVHGRDSSGFTQPLRTSLNGSVFVGDIANGADADGNADGVDVFDDGGGAGQLNVRSYLYNGTTWDRPRGSIANGQEVDVTQSVLPAGAATEASLLIVSNDLKELSGTAATMNTSLDNIELRQGAAQSNFIMDGTTQATVKFAEIDATVNGDNEIVAAVGGKKIRVVDVTWIATGNVTVRWESSTAGNFISGPMTLSTSSGASPSYSPVGIMETVAGESLNLTLDANPNVGGMITYIEVD